MNDINGNPWQEALDEQQNEERNSVLQQDLDAQRAMLADSENAARRDAQADAQKQLFMRNLIGTVVKRSGGNPISRRLANWANVALKKAGVRDIGIMTGGGFGDDGNFVVPTFSGVDQNGQPVASDGIKYGPEALFSMMNQLRGIFSDSDRKAMSDRLRDSGVGEEQIASMSYNPFETMMTDREQARRSMRRSPSDPDHIRNRMRGGAGGRQVGGAAVFKGRDTRPHGVHSFSSDGQGGFSSMDWTLEDGETRRDWGTRDPNYQGRWKVRVNGPDGKVYENDKTGEEITVRPGENLRDVLVRSIRETKPSGGAGVEVAKINAASREKVADMNNKMKLNLANLSGNQKKELAEAANALKKYGIDVGLQIAQEKNESREKVADQREKGRQARATLRDSQAWAKLAIEHAKVDNNFAVQMKKADTYGKRIDLIEKKIRNDYEVQMKRAKTDEERQKAEATYKERRADIEEGNLDLGWFRAEATAEQGQQKIDNDKAQKEADRQLRRELAELQARAKRGVLGGDRGTSADALKSIQQLQKILDGGNLTGENRKSIKDRMNGIAADLDADKATVKSGDNSGDEKRPTGYRYNKSRTKRIPCYADGTEGPVEDVQ